MIRQAGRVPAAPGPHCTLGRREPGSRTGPGVALPTVLEFGLSVIIGACLVLCVVALPRPRLGPTPLWMAGWVAAGLSGILVLVGQDARGLGLLIFPLGTLFPWLLLAGALEFAGGRVPGWMLPGALAYGLARSALAAVGRVDAAYAMALAVEPWVALAAGWVVHRALTATDANLGQRLLAPSFVLIAAAGFLRKPYAPEELVASVRTALASG